MHLFQYIYIKHFPICPKWMHVNKGIVNEKEISNRKKNNLGVTCSGRPSCELGITLKMVNKDALSKDHPLIETTDLKHFRI